MHNHDQGLQPGCRWCDLDILLHELAAQWGPSNLDSYLRVEMNAIWNSPLNPEAGNPDVIDR